MKIAIYSGYGGIYVPPFVQEQLVSDSFLRNRIEIASIIEKLEPTHAEITQEVYNEFSSCKNKTIKYLKSNTNNNIVYLRNLEEKYGQVCQVHIEDVDTSKLWKISDYDGAESVEYHTESIMIDEELNYGDW